MFIALLIELTVVFPMGVVFLLLKGSWGKILFNWANMSLITIVGINLSSNLNRRAI